MRAEGEGLYKWTVLLITSIGAFMTPLDGTIVSVSMPSIAKGLNMTYESVIWVPTAYLVALTVLLLSLGRLSDSRGRKPIFVAGFAIFAVTSFLCGTASSGSQLIAFRAIQGAGAAFIGATSAAIITDTFPAKERGKALGINTMSVYVGLSVGPSLGGFLTSAYGWRSIFYVNVPLALLVIGLALTRLKEAHLATLGRGFDIAGAGTFSAGLVAVLVGLTLGDSWGWGAPPIVGLLAAGGLLLVSFVFIERRRGSKAMVDLSLFTGNRLFAAANLSALLNYTSYFGVSFFVSFYLQRVLGYAAFRAGLVLLVMPLCMAFLSPVSGWLSDRFGSRGFSSLGMALISAGLLVMSALGLTSSSTQVILGLFIIGVGMGLFSSPNTSAVMGSVERDKLGLASGTLATMRFSGQSLSLALMGAIVASAAAPGLLSSLFIGVGTSALNVAAEAFVEGMRRAFIVSAVIAAIGLFTSLQRGGREGKGAVPGPSKTVRQEAAS
jgi:EmrB/QacA subfamily drug resistance transporter